MNNKYSAKFIPLVSYNYTCYDVGVTGGGGDAPVYYGRGLTPVDPPSGEECTSTSDPITTVNMLKPFLLPLIYNINSLNKILSVTTLKKNDLQLIDPLSWMLNIDSNYTPYLADSTNIRPPFLRAAVSDNMFLMSDLHELELSPGVYDFDKFVYPITGSPYPDDKHFTQYLFYFEKN